MQITYTRGIGRNLENENSDEKSVNSADDQNDNDDSDKSVEELVSESNNNEVNDNVAEGDNNIDRRRGQTTTTRFGRSVRPRANYDEFIKIGINEDKNIDEYAFIMSTEELHVMKYNEAMKLKDKESWIKAVQEEHDRMIKSGVWTAVNKDTLKATNKVLTTTWAMKKKPNGSYRARINAQGFKQLDGLHYGSSAPSSPVSNDTTVRVIFTLAMLAGLKGYVIDDKGAFLNGRFDKGEELFLKVPQGFEQFYKESQVLKLKRTIYGLKQAAQAFWTELLRALTAMGFERSDGDPCCYYKT
jgi:Reverse transcriptase (RNA-dependent DNA polymerase)